MGRKQQPRIRFGERDLAILRYLAEQHTSWFDAIHSRFYAGRRVAQSPAIHVRARHRLVFVAFHHSGYLG